MASGWGGTGYASRAVAMRMPACWNAKAVFRALRGVCDTCEAAVQSIEQRLRDLRAEVSAAEAARDSVQQRIQGAHREYSEARGSWKRRVPCPAVCAAHGRIDREVGGCADGARTRPAVAGACHALRWMKPASRWGSWSHAAATWKASARSGAVLRLRRVTPRSAPAHMRANC